GRGSWAGSPSPACTSFTRTVFEVGICQTLASYVSMQTLPTFTESGGHLSVPAPAGTAATRQTAVQPTTMDLRNPFMVLPSLFPPHPASRSWAAEPAAVVPTRPRALPARPSGRRPARRPLRRGRSNRANNVRSGRGLRARPAHDPHDRRPHRDDGISIRAYGRRLGYGLPAGFWQRLA